MGTDARPCPSAGGGLITFKNSVVAELLQPLPIVRLEKAKQLARSMGAEIKSFHLLQGRYDAVVFADAPSAEVVAKFSLAIGSLGNVHTETLRAFTEDEYRKIVSALP